MDEIFQLLDQDQKRLREEHLKEHRRNSLKNTNTPGENQMTTRSELFICCKQLKGHRIVINNLRDIFKSRQKQDLIR
jgi:hypothetical protein